MKTSRGILLEFINSEQELIDVVGYFECFNDGGLAHVLCAIGFIFEKATLYVVAQEDDSFVLHSSNWCGDPKWFPVSFVKKPPWSSAIGNPLLWSWVLYNQQGYCDGIQLEFGKNTGSQSTVVQLVALGSEIELREVAGKCSTITFTP